jgi:hypothetical protein
MAKLRLLAIPLEHSVSRDEADQASEQREISFSALIEVSTLPIYIVIRKSHTYSC